MSEPPQQTEVHYPIVQWLGFLSVLVLLFLATWGAIKLFDPRSFPIRHVSVRGNYHYLNPLEVRELLVRALYSHSFFSVSVDYIRALLEKTPWIHRVEIRRVWPDTLDIRIEERQFAARWGKSALLSASGEIINLHGGPTSAIFPVFWGEASRAQALLAAYHSFSERLKPLELKISELFLDARQSWRVKLTSGMVIELGRNGFDKKFDRFINFYRQYLSKQDNKVASVDMRYTNGASLSWK